MERCRPRAFGGRSAAPPLAGGRRGAAQAHPREYGVYGASAAGAVRAGARQVGPPLQGGATQATSRPVLQPAQALPQQDRGLRPFEA